MKQFLIKHKLLVRSAYFGIIVAFILMSLTAYWISNTLYNTQNFTRIATNAIEKESSRQAIAASATNKALENFPIISATAGPKVQTALASALDSSTAKNVLQKTIENIKILLTTPRKPPVQVDLRGVKGVLARAQEILPVPEKLAVDVSNFPDTYVILDTANLPNFHSYGLAAIRLGPITAALAFIMLIYWVRKGGKKNILSRIRTCLIVVAVASGIALLMGPLVKPSVLAMAADAPSQTLIGNLYQGFISPFNNVAMLLGGLSISIWLIIYVYEWLTSRYRFTAKFTFEKLKS